MKRGVSVVRNANAGKIQHYNSQQRSELIRLAHGRSWNVCER